MYIYSSLSLAYIGDSVYESYIRTRLLEDGDKRVKDLHRRAKGYVSAKAQCEIVYNIMEYLDEEEIIIFKRGRNTKVNTKAKNADIKEYHSATGLEALIGHHYLSGNSERLKQLLDLCYDTANRLNDEKNKDK